MYCHPLAFLLAIDLLAVFAFIPLLLLGSVAVAVFVAVWPLLATLPARHYAASGKHERAYAAYEKSLKLIPRWHREGRARAMQGLATEARKTGRLADALRWSEEVRRSETRLAQRLSVPTQPRVAPPAADPYAEIDPFPDGSEPEETGDDLQDSVVWAERAAQFHERGEMAEAIEACDRAMAASPIGCSVATLKADCLRAMGRPDEALETLRQGRDAWRENALYPAKATGRKAADPEFATKARQVDSLTTLCMSWAALEAGRFDDAQEYLNEAGSGMADDASLSALCTATAAWLFAVAGQPEDAKQRLSEADELMEFLDEQAVRQMLPPLARAAVEVGHDERALVYLSKFLSGNRDAILETEALYLRGECLLRQGNTAQARIAFTEATEGARTIHARKAAARLEPAPSSIATNGVGTEQPRPWWMEGDGPA